MSGKDIARDATAIVDAVTVAADTAKTKRDAAATVAQAGSTKPSKPKFIPDGFSGSNGGVSPEAGIASEPFGLYLEGLCLERRFGR